MLGPRVTAVLAFVLLALAPAGAQEPGQGGAQQPQNQDAAPAPAPPAPDYREEMRRFIQAIGTFARQNRRDFLIIPQNGLELLAKVDTIDTSQRSPARTYMRSIDGVLQEALYFGDPDFDKPPPAERQEKLLKLTELARTNGLRVLVMDYGRKAKTVNDSHRRNAAKGYVPFVAHDRAQELGSLPRYPRRPFHENGASVLSLKSVRNFLYLRNSAPFGRQDEFAMALRGTNFDMVVVDVFHGRTPLTKQAVESLKYKEDGRAAACTGLHGHRLGGTLPPLLEARMAGRLAQVDQRTVLGRPRQVLCRVLARRMAEDHHRRHTVLRVRHHRSGLRRRGPGRRRRVPLFRKRRRTRTRTRRAVTRPPDRGRRMRRHAA